MKYEITKEFSFDAAHFLQVKEGEMINRQKTKNVYGKCSNVHGHRFTLFVTVGSAILKDGMVMNFSELKNIINQLLINDLDHTLINDISWLYDIVPTCENLLEKFWGRLINNIPDERVKLIELRLYETPESFGIYRG